MKSKYSEAFIKQAVVKLLSRGQRTVREVALDINVNYHTAKNWMKRGLSATPAVGSTKEKRPQDWTAQEQLLALQESHGVSGEVLAWSGLVQQTVQIVTSHDLTLLVMSSGTTGP